MMSNNWLRSNGLHLSWLVALVAMVGSLYFSEVMHLAPCKLCWYQRILMYPLAIILGIAAVRKDFKITIYVLPLAIWGFCISVYHVLLQEGVFHESATGCGPIACDTDYLNWGGWITIPMLAGTAFLLIIILQFLTYRASK